MSSLPRLVIPPFLLLINPLLVSVTPVGITKVLPEGIVKVWHDKIVKSVFNVQLLVGSSVAILASKVNGGHPPSVDPLSILRINPFVISGKYKLPEPSNVAPIP